MTLVSAEERAATDMVEPAAATVIEPARAISDVSARAVATLQEHAFIDAERWSRGRHFAEEQAATLDLYREVSISLAESPNMTLQFIGPEGKEGVTTIARRFAYMGAAGGKLVLFMECDSRGGRFNEAIDDVPSVGWADLSLEDTDPARAIYRVGSGRLCYSPFSGSQLAPPISALTDRFAHFLELVRSHFDLVVIDSTPAMGFHSSLLVSPRVDGVVIVAAAESTKIESVGIVRDKIQQMGGKVVGVVVNRHRSYLPGFLSRML